MNTTSARARSSRPLTLHYLGKALEFTALPALLVALWFVLTERSQNFFVPPLSEVVAAFPSTWFHGRLQEDVLPSVARLLAGYFTALALGIGLGTVIGSFKIIRSLLEPVLAFLRVIPPPVLVPILMLFAGIGTQMKVLVIVSGCIWPILLNTVEGVRGVDPVLRETSSVYHLGRIARLRTLTLRAASPYIMAGARQSLSIAILLMVISEMFAANSGLGFSLVQFQRTFAIREMWSAVILLGILGVALSVVFRVAERLVLRWYYGFRRAEGGGTR